MPWAAAWYLASPQVKSTCRKLTSRKTWGWFTIWIAWKITIALRRSQPLSSFSSSCKGKIFVWVHVPYVVLIDPLQRRPCPKWQLLFWIPGASWWNMLSESWWILPSPYLFSVSLGTVNVVLKEEGRGKGEGLRNNLSSIPPSIQQAAGSNWVSTWSTKTVSD